MLLFVENLELLHTKKRDTCDKIRICSNSRYFDFEIDPDRVTGVSLFCRDIRIVLHPKKRHAGHRIRMHSISLEFVLRPKKRHTLHKIQILLALKCRNVEFNAHEKVTYPSQDPDAFEFA